MLKQKPHTLATWCKQPTQWKRPWCWERLKAKKRVAGDETVRQHHQLNTHELEWTAGDSGGHRELACCSPQGHKESNVTWPLNNNNELRMLSIFQKNFKSNEGYFDTRKLYAIQSLVIINNSFIGTYPYPFFYMFSVDAFRWQGLSWVDTADKMACDSWNIYYLVISREKVYPSLALHQSFHGGSEVKASACSAGDPGSIPWSGRSPGEGNGNPLQYSWETSAAEGKGVTGDNEKAPLAAAENTSSLMFRGYLSLGGVGRGEQCAGKFPSTSQQRERKQVGNKTWLFTFKSFLILRKRIWLPPHSNPHPPHKHTYLYFINMHKWSPASCHGKQEDMTCPPNGS